MKTIYFGRHAKSSWADFSIKDFDRPLNNRGKRDAPFMSEKMKEFGVQPDAIISSPANRALTTATFFAKALGISPKNILLEEKIYEAHPASIMEVVHSMSDNLKTILIFGHNPSFTMLANSFTTSNHIANIPTCGIVKIVANVDKWTDFNDSTGKLTEFHYPKQYL